MSVFYNFFEGAAVVWRESSGARPDLEQARLRARLARLEFKRARLLELLGDGADSEWMWTIQGQLDSIDAECEELRELLGG